MWIELHTSLLTHPKKNRLARLLKVKPPHALGLAASLFLFVGLYAEDTGELTKFSAAEIADGIHWPGDSSKLIESFVEAGFIDKEQDGRLFLHDWGQMGTRLKKQNRNRVDKFRGKNKENGGSAALNAMR